MSSRGVMSPWGKKPEEAPKTLEERVVAAAQKGHSIVKVDGRGYQLLITVPAKLRVGKLLEDAAKSILEEYVNEAGKPLLKELELQSASFTRESLLGPVVEIPLRTKTLYFLASSSSKELAEAMAVDRLALAITYFNAKNRNDLLKKYGIQISRQTNRRTP